MSLDKESNFSAPEHAKISNCLKLKRYVKLATVGLAFLITGVVVGGVVGMHLLPIALPLITGKIYAGSTVYILGGKIGAGAGAVVGATATYIYSRIGK